MENAATESGSLLWDKQKQSKSNSFNCQCVYPKTFNFQLITGQKSSKSGINNKTNSTRSCRAGLDTQADCAFFNCMIGSRIPKHYALSYLIIN